MTSSPPIAIDWRAWIDRAVESTQATLDRLPAPLDEKARADAERVIAMTFAQGYWMMFHGHADHPEWLPFISFLLPSGAINPDTSYDACRIDPDGTYRLSGYRGSVKLLDFQLSQSLPGIRDHSGARTGGLDADALTIDAQGRFDVLLSRQRPAGHQGDWCELPPETGSILMRQVRYDWTNEVDARVAIERLDRPVRRLAPDPATIRARLDYLPDFVLRYQRQFLNYKTQVRDLGPPNQLHRRVRKETGGAGEGGGMGGQVIYHGNFALAPGECLLVETAIPESCTYWNIQVTDPVHLAIEPVFCQTSLNGFQARLDSDGRFRAVIAAEDPGVPNWLDTAGHLKGGIIGRWTRSSAAPIPETRVVPIDRLREHLPADTPSVSPDERDHALRARVRAAQMRRGGGHA